MTTLQNVIAENRNLVARARELNIRAGERIFPVPTRPELTKFFTVALGGARRVAEVRNLPALLLPALDQKAVEKVLCEQPDTITILGQGVTVEYRSGYTPRACINFRGDNSRDWLQLPDDGIRLPGGREVSMYSALEGYGYYVEADSSQFKEKARECLNQGLWEKWQKPELPTPTESIAPIVEMEYGRCVVTGTVLLACGTVKYDSWYGSWKSYWSRDRSKIERIHAQACEKFVEVKEKVARDALKKRVGELHSAHNYNRELPEELRARMYNTYYGHSGGATTVAEIEAFITEIEAAVATIEERKTEAARQQRAAEDRLKEVNAALERLNVWAAAHIWVPEGGGEVAYVLGGKTSKMGDFIVLPTVVEEEPPTERPYCFGDQKYQFWVPFPVGVRSQAQDFSARGRLQSEVSLLVPKGLLQTSVVYGVSRDDEGEYFFPVVYHDSHGTMIVPELAEVRKIRVEEVTPPSSSTDDQRGRPVPPTALDALRRKWGA